MHRTPNPFEPTTQIHTPSSPVNLESIQRVRYVVSMWVCGFIGIACIPAVPPDAAMWTKLSNQTLWNVHLAWIAPFACGLASIITAICLFRLPRISDKVGALTAIALVGFWPTILAIYWWCTFAWVAIHEWIR